MYIFNWQNSANFNLRLSGNSWQNQDTCPCHPSGMYSLWLSYPFHHEAHFGNKELISHSWRIQIATLNIDSLKSVSSCLSTRRCSWAKKPTHVGPTSQPAFIMGATWWIQQTTDWQYWEGVCVHAELYSFSSAKNTVKQLFTEQSHWIKIKTEII